MKITIFLLTVLCLHVSARSWSQKVTLSVKNMPLQKVFSLIEKQTGYAFFYDLDLLNGRTASLDVKDAEITAVLKECLRDLPLDFKVVNTTIAIIKRQPPKVVAELAPAPRATTEVKGQVKTEAGAPMPDATVTLISGKIRKSIATNAEGEFVVPDLPKGKYTMEITFIGYETFRKEVIIGDQAVEVSAILKAAISGLDEMQVIAYGTTTKRLNTGNVTTVKAKEIEQQPVSNVLAALEGRVPGLAITQTTGQPGGGFTVQIRGQNSILNGNDPFYVVDGVPYNSQIPSTTPSSQIPTGLLNSSLQGGSPLNYINPYDIESIEVLKDADATAIYGSRAANGAILITTKKGKVGPIKLDININSGITSPVRSIQLMNTEQFLAVRHEAFKNDGATPNVHRDFDLTFWDTTRYTDWSKIFLDNHAVYTDANASVSGGNSNTQYLIGAGFNRQTSGMPVLVPGNGANQKGSAHISINTFSPDKRFKLALTSSYISDVNRIDPVDLSQTQFSTLPDAPPLYNPDGSLNWAPLAPGLAGTWTNPLAQFTAKYKGNTSNLVSNAVMSYMLLPGLELRTSLGYTNTQIDEVNIYPTTGFDPNSNPTSGYAYYAETNTRSWIIEPQAEYRSHLGKGLFTVLIGSSFHENNSKVQSLSGDNYSSDALLENIQAAGSLTATSNSSKYKYDAVFGRLSYNWQDKYLVNLTARRDGSSRFGPGRQFGNFGSVGAAWIFSREALIQRALPFLSFGKLRASYGSTGNDQIGDYQFLDLYSATTFPYLTAPGLIPQNLFNPNLAWEIDKKLEEGLELGFLKDRITIQASIYRNRSGNQLVTTPVSLVTGFSSTPANLPALVQNSGQEFELHTVNVKSKDFTWSSFFTLTIPHNKLLSFPGLATSSYASTYIIGQPISIKKVYHLRGVNETTGIFQFSDFKGNLTYTPNSSTDMTGIVNNAPKFYGGFLNSFNYKGFSLDFLFQFVKQEGHSLYGVYGTLNRPMGGGRLNIPVAFLNHWQRPGDKAKYQMATQSNSNKATQAFRYANQSDLGYDDESFIRLKNLAFSWQLPEIWKQKMRLQNCRIYVNAQNLLTISKYNGIDPETQSIYSPPKKVWVVGLQIKL